MENAGLTEQTVNPFDVAWMFISSGLPILTSIFPGAKSRRDGRILLDCQPNGSFGGGDKMQIEES